MNLQDTFYIIGIVCMSLMLILLVGLVASIFVIRAKINALHRDIEDKLHALIKLITTGSKVVSKVKRAIKR